MNKTVKSLLLVLCALVFFAAGIFATLAYLNDTTEKAVNTMTIGNVQIDLDEAQTNEYGQKLDKNNDVVTNETPAEDYATRIPDETVTDDEGNVIKGNVYTLVPGRTYSKDPIIHVLANSEPAYVFVRVVNNIVATEDANNTVESQILANDWDLVSGDEKDGMYVYTGSYAVDKAVSTKDGLQKDLPVFEKIVVDKNKDYDFMKDYEGKTIEVQGFAIQAAELSYDDAKDIAYDNLYLSVNP